MGGCHPGEHDDLRARDHRMRPELLQDPQSVQAGHDQVQEHHVRPLPLQQLQRLITIPGGGAHRHVLQGGEEIVQQRAGGCVVLRQQDTNRSCHPSSDSIARTRSAAFRIMWAARPRSSGVISSMRRSIRPAAAPGSLCP